MHECKFINQCFEVKLHSEMINLVINQLSTSKLLTIWITDSEKKCQNFTSIFIFHNFLTFPEPNTFELITCQQIH